MWILLENSEEWEAFSWGSYSFQALKDTITNVMRKERVPDSGIASYHLKGNTIAFSAWIFEAIPAFGEAIGGKNPKRQRPRFLRYNFVKKSKFPIDRQIEQNTLPLLKPHDKELTTDYWKSLENDPEGRPFAFKYNPNDSKRKRPRDETLPTAAKPGSSHPAPAAILHISDEDMQKIGEHAGEAAAKKMLEFMETFRQQIVKDVVQKLAEGGHHEDARETHEDFNVFQMHDDDIAFSLARHASSLKGGPTTPTSHTLTSANVEATIQLETGAIQMGASAGEEAAAETGAGEGVAADTGAGEEAGAGEETSEAAPGAGEEAGTEKATQDNKAAEAGIEVAANTSIPESQAAAEEGGQQKEAAKKSPLKRYGRTRTAGAKKARKETTVAATTNTQMPKTVAAQVDEPQTAWEASEAAPDDGNTCVPAEDKVQVMHSNA